MFLTSLNLTQFRRFPRLDLDLPGGSIMLVGGNAQGKTSLLEAIHYLAAFSSFNASSDRQLINFLETRKSQAVTKIRGRFQLTTDSESSLTKFSAGHEMEVRLILEPIGQSNTLRFRKEILFEGVRKKLSEVIGIFNAVLFLPQMLGVVEGSPEERRRYLNLAIGQVVPGYVLNLADYNRALSQRNALLKQLHERGGDLSQLDFWDDLIARKGAHIIHARIHAVQDLEKLAGRLHGELTSTQETLRLSYEPAFDPLPTGSQKVEMLLDAPVDRKGISIEKIHEGFLAALKRHHRSDISHGLTSLGPHRDDVRFISNYIDLGIYGSRGQGRTAVLSLKLAEVEWVHEKTGQWPVLLLDEVLAELDTERRNQLLNRLRNVEQAILTTTDLNLFSPDFVRRGHVLKVENFDVHP